MKPVYLRDILKNYAFVVEGSNPFVHELVLPLQAMRDWLASNETAAVLAGKRDLALFCKNSKRHCDKLLAEYREMWEKEKKFRRGKA